MQDEATEKEDSKDLEFLYSLLRLRSQLEDYTVGEDPRKLKQLRAFLEHEIERYDLYGQE